MFERFTERARRIVVLAQEEARLLKHSHIGTEHVLLGLVAEGEGVAAKALVNCDVELEQVRKEVVAIIGEGEQAPSGHIPFTPRAKKVMELAMREALQLGHNYIGTEHILLGLIREGEGIAAQVLHNVGVEMGVVRKEVIKLLTGQTKPADPPPPDLIVITREHPEGLRFAGELEECWDLAERQLLPRRKDRIKWDAAKELMGGR